MKRVLFAVLAVAFVCAMATNANAGGNHNAKFALHYAGPHDSKANTCDYVMDNCHTDMVTEVGGSGRYDIYALAVDVGDFAGCRYGLTYEAAIGVPCFFYGWTKCSDLEIPTENWPGVGEGEAQAWSIEKTGQNNVTLGILDVYVYAGSNGKLAMTKDPRVDFGEFCDGHEPLPDCDRTTSPQAFGFVGFNRLGYNPCGEVPVENTSWGAVKSLYR
jgi:hypothetical protein